MADKGTIRGKDIADQSTYEVGQKLADSIKPAITEVDRLKSNWIKSMAEIKASVLEFNKLENSFKSAKNLREFTEAKKAQTIVIEKASAAKKAEAQTIILLQKAETEKQRTEKESLNVAAKKLDLDRKQEAATKRKTKLTVQEKVELQILNRNAKEAAVISSSLSSEYEKQSAILTSLRKKYKDVALTQGETSKKALQLKNRIDKLDTTLKRVDGHVGQFQRHVGHYGKALSSAGAAARSMMSAMGAVGGAYLFVNVMRDAFTIVREFGATMANVAGIYRTSREDLADLEQEIISVAGSSVRTTNDVAKLAESLATLGKSKEDIKNLLEPVNNLSIGLKAGSADTAEFLVQTINAFGGSTDEAEKYADTIATIRTSTSLDFQKMRDSFQYLTPISRILNKDLAHTGALIGILADNGLKAESSGRLLATSQIKLATKGKTLQDGLNEINEAREKGIEGTDLLIIANELFGKQAAKIGVILAENSDQIDINAQAIRDNGGALDDLVNEQLKSLDSSLAILKSKWEEYILNTDESSEASSKLITVINFLSENLSTLIDVVLIGTGVFVAWKAVILVTALAQRVATAATVAYRIAIVAMNGGVLKAVRALKFLRVALINSGIGAAVIAVIALVVALSKMNSELSLAEKRQKIINDARKEAAKSIAKEKSELDTLLQTAKNENLSKEKRLEAIEALNKISPEHLGNINLENIATQETTESVEAYIKALDDKAYAQALNNKKTELYKKLIDTENSSIKDNISWYQELGNTLLSAGNTYSTIARNTVTGIKNRKAEADSIRQEILLLNSLIRKKTEESESGGNGGGGNGGTSELTEAQIKAIAARQKQLNDDLFNLQKARLQSQIDFNKDIVDNEDSTLAEKQIANIRYFELKNELLLLQRNKELEDAKGRVSKLAEINLKYEDDKIDLEQARAKSSLAILEANFKDKLKVIKEAKAAEQAAENAEIEVEQDKFKNSGQTIEDVEAYELAVFEIKKKYALANVQTQIDAIDAINKADFSPEQIEQLEAQKLALKQAYKDIETSQLIDATKKQNKKELEEAERLANAKKELLKSSAEGLAVALNIEAENINILFNSIDDAISNIGKSTQEQILASLAIMGAAAGVTREIIASVYAENIADLEDQLEASNAYYDNEYARAEGDDIQQKLIRDRQKKEEDQLRKEIAKEKTRAAKADKQAALVAASINTAVAVTSVSPNLPLMLLAATLGAAQFALIAAKKIPKFKEGTRDFKGGLAWLGDGGVSEYYRTPDGTIGKTPNTDTLYNLPKGTDVFKNEQEAINEGVFRDHKDYKKLMRDSMVSDMMSNSKRVREYQQTSQNTGSKFDEKVIKNAIAEGFKEQKVHFHTTTNTTVDMGQQLWTNQELIR